jgi:hypothetical protein
MTARDDLLAYLAARYIWWTNHQAAFLRTDSSDQKRDRHQSDRNGSQRYHIMHALHKLWD